MGMSLAEGRATSHTACPENETASGFKVRPAMAWTASEALTTSHDAWRHEHKPDSWIIAGRVGVSRCAFDSKTVARVAAAVGDVFNGRMAHYAGLIAAGVLPHRATSRRGQLHHAQEPATAARRHHIDEGRFARATNSAIFPDPGRP